MDHVRIDEGIKRPKRKGKLTPDEEKFRMNWKGGYKIVEDLDGVKETVDVLIGWHLKLREIK